VPTYQILESRLALSVNAAITSIWRRCRCKPDACRRAGSVGWTAAPDILSDERDVSVALQLARQLAEPAPYDLDETDLRSYKRLDPRWQDWAAVRGQLRELAVALTEALTEDG
jgi:hypothetical protein